MKEKLVDIKIRKKYRDILKNYSKTHGIKMYRLVENLIEERCGKPNFKGRKLLNSQLEG
jgi:hypothetical protein